MKRLIPGILIVAAFSASVGSARADSNVYLCIDEHGTKEYKNTGDTKGCKKVNLPALTVAAPVRSGNESANKPQPATPSDFPQVDGGTQKARDNDRRQILEDELKSEQRKLSDLEKDYHNIIHI